MVYLGEIFQVGGAGRYTNTTVSCPISASSNRGLGIKRALAEVAEVASIEVFGKKMSGLFMVFEKRLVIIQASKLK